MYLGEHDMLHALRTTLPVCTQNRWLHFVCIAIPQTFRRDPSETFVLRLQREEVRCDFGLILLNFLVSYECVVGNTYI